MIILKKKKTNRLYLKKELKMKTSENIKTYKLIKLKNKN
jgi:hypothetical protein